MLLKFFNIFILLFFFIFSLPTIENNRPFQTKGETLKFEIRYLGIVGGHAVLTATPIPKKKVIKLEIRAYTIKWVENIFRLRLYMSSFSKEKDFQTLMYSETKQENKRYNYNVQRFFPSKKYYIFSDKRNKGKERVAKVNYVEAGGLSVVAAFHYGRTLKLKVGKVYYNNCFFRDEKPRKIGIRVLRKETIKTKWGERDTIVITPEMDFRGFFSDQKKMEIYLSDDKYRVPLLMHSDLAVGSIQAVLVEGYPTLN